MISWFVENIETFQIIMCKINKNWMKEEKKSDASIIGFDLGLTMKKKPQRNGKKTKTLLINI